MIDDVIYSISHRRRRLLLGRHALDKAIRPHRLLDHRLAEPRRQLDRHAEHQLLRRAAHPLRDIPLASGLVGQRLADRANVLGRHAGLLPRQRFRFQVSRSHQ